MTPPLARPFSKVLVENRGEIARRVIVACRSLGIATVAVHSEPDASAPFVAEADQSVALGGASAADTYLDVDKLIEAARRPARTPFIRDMGSWPRTRTSPAPSSAGADLDRPAPGCDRGHGIQGRARALMEAAGVPVVPGAELGEGTDAAAEAERVGFPLLVKASAGGGGKGMRPVDSAAELEGAIEGARREAGAAFGDSTVFLERYLQRPRHIEIQLLADTHGATVSLGERECSIQRRHQKVLEESPSPAVDPELRERLGAAAVAAAEAVGYVGAGTVEFMLAADGGFHFLEMNTRLQVEHPVTEMVLGLDLVAEQLRIAAGEPLSERAREPRIGGHAIEVRLYAEDPASGYLPQAGSLSRFEVPGAEPFAVPRGGADPVALRLDSGVESGRSSAPTTTRCWPSSSHGRPRARGRRAAGGGAHRSGDRRPRHQSRPARPGAARSGFVAGETDTGFLERGEGAEQPARGG